MVGKGEARIGIGAQNDGDLPFAFAVDAGVDPFGRKAQHIGDVVAGDAGGLGAFGGIDGAEDLFLFPPVHGGRDDVRGRGLQDLFRGVGEIAQNFRVGAGEAHLDRVTAARPEGQAFRAKLALRQGLCREGFEAGDKGGDLLDRVGADDDVAVAGVRVFSLIGQHEARGPLAHEGGGRDHVVLRGEPVFQHFQIAVGFVDRRALGQFVIDEEEGCVAVGEELLLDLTEEHEADDRDRDQPCDHQPPEFQA